MPKKKRKKPRLSYWETSGSTTWFAQKKYVTRHSGPVSAICKIKPKLSKLIKSVICLIFSSWWSYKQYSLKSYTWSWANCLVTGPQKPRKPQPALSGVCLERVGRWKHSILATAEMTCLILPVLQWFDYGLPGRGHCRSPLEQFDYFVTFSLGKLISYTHKHLKNQFWQCLHLVKKECGTTVCTLHHFKRRHHNWSKIQAANSARYTDVDAEFVRVKPLISLSSCSSDDIMVRAQLGWQLRK